MADPYAPVTGNAFYSDFSGTAGRQQFPWEDLTSGMSQQQYWDYIGSLANMRGSGFNQGTLPTVSSSDIFPITQGYDPLSGFNYTNQYGGPDNIFTPQTVPNVGAEQSLNAQLLAEQQAAQAALANKPGLGSQIGYGVLGAVTGIPGGLIQSGVNALTGMGGQTIAEGGMLPAYYTSGAPTGYVDAAGFPVNPDTGLRYDIGTPVVGGGGGAAVTPSTTPRTSTATTTATTTATGTGDATMLDPFKVTDTSLPSATLGGGSSIGATGGGVPPTVGGGTVNLPAVTVSDTKINTPYVDPNHYKWIFESAGYTYDPATGKYTLPPVKVTPPAGSTTTSTTNVSNTPINFAGFKSQYPVMGPYASTSTPSTSTASTTATSTSTLTGTGAGDNLGLGSLVGTATGLGTGTAARNFPGELAASTAALRAQQGNLMGMYGSIYQNLLGQTAIPQAAQQSLAQMQADAAKLQRIQQGQLSSEDIRQSQQAAREAYGARGQVMGPGAIGAEILNREAIRQQREDQARNAYQASMGNVFNAAQLQTGNIFSPIGNLVSGTFNPLGAYPQDVYSSNVNAQLARDIAAANNAAAIEAAKYGAAASQKAATTSALGNILGKIVPGIFG